MKEEELERRKRKKKKRDGRRGIGEEKHRNGRVEAKKEVERRGGDALSHFTWSLLRHRLTHAHTRSRACTYTGTYGHCL